MPVNGNKLKIRLGHTHKQEAASDTWTVQHNLGREVIHDVTIDLGGVREKILPRNVEYPDNMTMIVRFSQPFTGTVRVS